jgi:hypothetical protein
MDRQSLALLIPIIALLIPVAAIVMGGILKIVKLHVEEAKIRAGALPDGAMAELEQVRSDMEQLRHELAEVHERLDFTERLVAQRREQERLPGHG